MITYVLDADFGNQDTSNIFFNQTTASVAVTLLSTNAGDGLAHKIVIGPDTTVSGSYTITGVDADGVAQTETLATSDANPVTSAKFYKSVSSIINCVTGGANVGGGWADDVVSPTYPIDGHSASAATIKTIITGTVNYDVQMILGQKLHEFSTSPAQDATWLPITAFDGKTATVEGTAPVGATAVRLLTNSYTNTAEIQLYLAQPTGND